MLNKEDILLGWTLFKNRVDWGDGLMSYVFKPYSYAGITGAIIKIILPNMPASKIGWIIGLLGLVILIISYFLGTLYQKSGAVNYLNNYVARKTVPFNEQLKKQTEAIGEKLGVESQFNE